jgi:hypothetical protein
MPEQMIFVRLKPYDPGHGCVLRTYIDHRTGIKFYDPGKWIEIPASLRDWLGKARQVYADPASPPAFDFAKDPEEIETIEAEWKRIQEERRRRAGIQVKKVVKSYTAEDLRKGATGVMTTGDLQHPEPEPALESLPEPAPEEEPPPPPKKKLETPKTRQLGRRARPKS